VQAGRTQRGQARTRARVTQGVASPPTLGRARAADFRATRNGPAEGAGRALVYPKLRRAS